VEDPDATILIVEDDLDIADMLNTYFRMLGYEVFTVNWGEDGIRACLTNQPDLVILDIRLPDVDGFEVAHRLKSNRRTSRIPIIFLTEKRERADKIRGLELSADDYITKPFDVQDLRLRVRNALERTHRESLNNPVTGLPEGDLVDEHLAQYLSTPDQKLVVVSIRNLRYFRESYGFIAADDLLRAVSMMIKDVLDESGIPEDFLGHLTETDFVILTIAPSVKNLTERLLKRLDQSFEYFYPHQDQSENIPHENGLSVKITELPAPQRASKDVQHLHTELEQIYR
jgi:DNA-binding response OmpR family regulator